MKTIYTILLTLLTSSFFGQNINYRLEIVEFYQTGCDDGIGSDEEPTWKLWARDNISTTWAGGDCNHTDGNIPITYVPSNVLLINKTNTTATLIDLRFHAWEDDCGDRCDFDPSCTLGTIEDDCEEYHDPLAGPFGTFSSINIQSQPMCQWNEKSYTVGPYGVKVRWNWEYTNFTAGTNQTICGNSVALAGEGSGEWSIISGTGGSLSDNFDPTASFNGVEGSSYVLDWNTLSGCLTTNSDNITINMYETPVPNLTASPNDFCEGYDITFTAEGGFNYDFAVSSTSNSVQNSGSDNYTISGLQTSDDIIYVTVENSDGCIAIDSIVTNVLSTPNPTITQSGGDLITDPFSFYQWYLDGNPIPGATSQTYTPTQNGTYYVEAVGSNGCIGQSSTFILSNVSVAELDNKFQFSVFPNPSAGQFMVNTDLRKYEGYISDLLGKRIIKLASNFSSINLEKVNSGIYFLNISSAQGIKSIKLIVE